MPHPLFNLNSGGDFLTAYGKHVSCSVLPCIPDNSCGRTSEQKMQENWVLILIGTETDRKYHILSLVGTENFIFLKNPSL